MAPEGQKIAMVKQGKLFETTEQLLYQWPHRHYLWFELSCCLWLLAMTQVVCNTHNAEGTGLPVTSYVKSLVICRHLSGSHEREPANDGERPGRLCAAGWTEHWGCESCQWFSERWNNMNENVQWESVLWTQQRGGSSQILAAAQGELSSSVNVKQNGKNNFRLWWWKLVWLSARRDTRECI